MNERRLYLPNRIRELRRERGLTLEQIGGAMKSKLTGSTVSKLEKGRQALSADYIAEIADVLGVAFEEVVRVPKGRKATVGRNSNLEDGDLCLLKTKDGDLCACRFEKDRLSFNPLSRRRVGERVVVGEEPFTVLANLGSLA